ncbi:glutamine synthetase family protein [Rhodococcus sp. ARC_M6]|uniref:glutamine synthetase family protein n=1 Tax=Rhodococcus sp. ARC_M6 TaxID=2928852 RepID=UPI001FB291B4|nr:glutamine synthetase family protein [Rhodococcus sp. ARC_M6]MCJ0906786.1 glutamine synthetase family protein [Rhodococcus sp. ARC_M6]
MTQTPALVIGSIVDLAGVARAKVVPANRVDAFVSSGMGASPSWNVFCADDALAFTENYSVVGDLRLRISESDLRDVGDGVSWAPATLHELDGSVSPVCSREALRRTTSVLASNDLEALVGREIEFTLFGGVPDEQWSAYGLGAALAQESFIRELFANAQRAQLNIEQFHAEYGPGQFEISLAPASPVESADNVILARILIGRTARAHGMTVSFSPMPTVGSSGNGAHQHFSLTRAGVPIFSGGRQAYGMTDDGAGALGGLVAHLGDLTAVLASSPLSGMRLQPNMWSGAFITWGQENREAAVRFCAESSGNPHGANVEVKVMDGSANPYLATAAILAAAHAGIVNQTPLPREVTVNPSTLTESARGERVPTDMGEILQRLRASGVARSSLGDSIIEALVAVKELEHSRCAGLDASAVVERLRYAWSV